jgi:hypothetical protein
VERRNVANRGGRIRQYRNVPRFPPKMRRSNRRAQAGQREGYCKKLRSNIGCLGIVGIARPPSRPVDAPSHGFPAPRTLEAVVAFAVHHRPRRLVDRHMVDLLRRQAGAVGQERRPVCLRRRLAAARRARSPPTPYIRRRRQCTGSWCSGIGSSRNNGRGVVGSRINGAMLIAARAVDRRFEVERRHLARRRERQPMQFAAAFRLRHD